MRCIITHDGRYESGLEGNLDCQVVVDLNLDRLIMDVHEALNEATGGSLPDASDMAIAIYTAAKSQVADMMTDENLEPVAFVIQRSLMNLEHPSMIALGVAFWAFQHNIPVYDENLEPLSLAA